MKNEDLAPVHESERRTRIGVIGCADIAVRRALPAIRESAFDLVAVASRSQEKAKGVAAAFDCEAVAGYDRLLDMPDVDAVYIPLPNSEHAEWANRALSAGKHVLIEKPAVPSEETARALVALAEERGLLIMENFAFLRHPQHDLARSLLADGAIGELRAFNGSFGIPPTDPQGIKYQADLGGGALWEVGCYPVRAAQEYLGAATRVLGAGLEFDAELGVDVSGAALLRDGAGVTANCSFGLSHSYRSTYDLWGSEGRLILEWAFTPSRDARPLLRLQQKDRETTILAPASDQFFGVFSAFHDAIRDPAARRVHHRQLVRQATLMARIRARADSANENG
ncbi:MULTISPECIES: Gfo/Idh/MocA family protein [unclassified Streptomyces]|uniref:Gfo/Idh/MocA family protein n=1 Tax=unclassified Streptomyces TaxID=2593676 RepID=UPI002256C629|nr:MULTISPECIES: Gfo/Idh/MocA family oxidoreductase [unclassified Streptomyces]MCX4527191.1 Gfo/Idh/MocA family oxidoreductase [Streptomyces sp. NBC_01551]MCX4542233.1 Gfo/Idh/MocA family oxidoreductase [Streptomyces sp. NBC_01565]